DQKEALTLAGRLAVMDRGKLAQVGTPTEVYARPANRFVAGFLGESNFIPGMVRDGNTVDTAVGPLTTPTDGFAPEALVTWSIRPQALALDRPDGFNRIAATVKEVLFLGDLIQLRLTAACDTELVAVALPPAVGPLRPGQDVQLTVGPYQVVLLPAE